MYPRDVSSGLQRLATCVQDLQSWCASRRLQLNAAKTELIWFGSRAAVRNPSVGWYLKARSVVVPPADVVLDLVVLLDSELTMNEATCQQTCFCHLRLLRQLKHYVDCSVMQLLVSAFILSRLDNCNSILIGLTYSTIAHCNECRMQLPGWC